MLSITPLEFVDISECMKAGMLVMISLGFWDSSKETLLTNPQTTSALQKILHIVDVSLPFFAYFLQNQAQHWHETFVFLDSTKFRDHFKIGCFKKPIKTLFIKQILGTTVWNLDPSWTKFERRLYLMIRSEWGTFAFSCMKWVWNVKIRKTRKTRKTKLNRE